MCKVPDYHRWPKKRKKNGVAFQIMLILIDRNCARFYFVAFFAEVDRDFS